MHICYLTPEFVIPGKPEGGLANYLSKISKSLIGMGHKVSICMLSDKDKSWNYSDINICEIRKFRSPHLERIPLIRKYLPVFSQVLNSKLVEKKVWEINQENMIDIIQVSSYKTPGLTMLSNRMIPIVCRLSSFTPLLRSINQHQRRRNIPDFIADWFELLQARRADAVFSPSLFISEIYKPHLGYKPTILRTPQSPTQEEDYNYSFYYANFHTLKYLLYVGTLSRVKGVDLFSEILSEILVKHVDLHFVFIGRDDGLPDGHKVYTKIIRNNKNIGRRLHYHPPVDRKKLLPIIKNSFSVIIPSRADNYPNVCLEAHMLNVPVVGTYNSSLEEMLIDGETGFLAENGDPKSIKNGIERLLGQSSTQRMNMINNIKLSNKRIESEDRMESLIEFYKRTIENYNFK